MNTEKPAAATGAQRAQRFADRVRESGGRVTSVRLTAEAAAALDALALANAERSKDAVICEALVAARAASDKR